jgi:hypothetical protein
MSKRLSPERLAYCLKLIWAFHGGEDYTVGEVEQHIIAIEAELEESRATNRRLNRLVSALEGALAQAREHPDGKMNQVYEAGFALARRDFRDERDTLRELLEQWLHHYPIPCHPIDWCPLCGLMGEHETGCLLEATETALHTAGEET